MAPLHRASGFVRGPSSSILDVLSASGCGAIMRQSRQKRMRHSHRLLGVGLDRLPPHFRMQGGVASHPEWSFGVHCDSAISSGGAGPRRAYRTFSFSLASDCGGTPMGHVTIGVRGGGGARIWHHADAGCGCALARARRPLARRPGGRGLAQPRSAPQRARGFRACVAAAARFVARQVVLGRLARRPRHVREPRSRIVVSLGSQLGGRFRSRTHV